MAEIEPFAGLYFDPAKVDVTSVVAPPYDVISPSEQTVLYDRSPANIVRLILNRDEPGDAPGSDRYSRAAEFLRRMRETGVLRQDSTPAVYEYVQRFAHPHQPERRVERTTLLLALRLEPYSNGVVLPHEETHPKAKADRLSLMRAAKANPEPIYGLYEDPALRIPALLEAGRGEAQPLVTAESPGAGRVPDEHIVYAHTDPSLLAAIREFFAPLRVWIADGHHRYETALNYRQERRAEAGPDGQHPWDSLLIGLSAFEDPGLVVLPTHRLIKNVNATRLEDLPLQLERYFHVRMMDQDAARAWIHESAAGETRFAVLKQGACYGLVLRDQSLMDNAGGEHCEAWKRLDVSILQMLVLDRSLGISWQSLAHTPDVAYTRSEQEAADRVNSGEFQLACLLRDPTVTEVRDVASSGDKMPQKSTFFYPKLWSGLIIRSLEE